MTPGQRYGPTPFRHNIRIGSILLPILVILLGFGGKLAAAIIMIGAMVRPDLLNNGYRTCSSLNTI